MNPIKKANEDAKLHTRKLSEQKLKGQNSDRGKAELRAHDQAKIDAVWVYFTVKQFCERHQAFTEGGIRHNIFHEKINGLAKSGAVVRNGRRVLIHEKKFFAWLEAQNTGVYHDS